jgi:hypothetical protein
VTIAEIEEIIMLVCVTGLVGYMGFIVVDLAKRSGAGKLGMYILLGVLMLAPAVFIYRREDVTQHAIHCPRADTSTHPWACVCF